MIEYNTNTNIYLVKNICNENCNIIIRKFRVYKLYF